MVFFILFGIFSFCCLGLSYLCYRIFLSKETGFTVIRAYLLFAIISCLLAPLVPVSWSSVGSQMPCEFCTPAGSIGSFTSKGLSASLPAGKIQYSDILVFFYLAGILFLVVRGLAQLWFVFRYYRGSTRIVRNGTVLFVHAGTESAFTFWRWIFIHHTLLRRKHVDAMIEHEKIHRRQWHTVDILVANLGCLLLWFNPFAWKIRSAIALNHEYLADRHVLRQGEITRENYQILLVNQVAEETLIPYSSAFNGKELRNRITMMSSRKSTGKATRKMMLIAPTLLVFFIVSTVVLSEFKATGKTVEALIQQNNDLVITGYAPGSKPAFKTGTPAGHADGTTVVYTVNGIDAGKIRPQELKDEIKSIDVTRHVFSLPDDSTTVVVNINTH